MQRVQVLVLSLVLLLAGMANSRAGMFVVDPTNSVLSIAGTVSAFQQTYLIRSQAPGSLLTTVTGSIDGTLSGGAFTINGAALTPILQPGVFQPFGLPADMVGAVPEWGASLAFRNGAYSLSSPAAPVVGGAFDASLATLGVDTLFDAEIIGFMPAFSSPLVGSLPQDSGLVGTLDIVGGQQRLILPIRTTLRLSDDTFSSVIILEGRILAFAPVPEPAGLALAAGGAGLDCVLVRRRRRTSR